ncbi:Intradiol ring-cleavage dioxygenase [Armillaria borealis]|uniref:Intradiol ring-cleavage dioxygenase n=1 Tax=Armillaria borealis TaxID=47425 RepID=A0AA39IY00_9AGAR|nr:Intradiol ring-cleavage dioxygenase [Armillaria borealis]
MELDQGMPSVRGEYVRSTISEDQSGVHTFVDLELIDVSTYETASDMYIDFWHCNSTGVYSGVLGSGNGNPSDLCSGRTFLRGIQPTNEEEQASFEPIFPGHSSGRATHFDTVIQSQGTASATALLPPPHDMSDMPTLHMIPGQIFFDRDLISIVGATSPYNTNIIEITTNSVDQVFVLGFGFTILEYLYLGEDISDAGVSSVDMSTMYEIIPAATLTEHGGVVHDPSSIEAGNMTDDFPSGTGSDHSTSSGSDTTDNLPSGD